jgi:hypothetical protein
MADDDRLLKALGRVAREQAAEADRMPPGFGKMDGSASAQAEQRAAETALAALGLPTGKETPAYRQRPPLPRRSGLRWLSLLVLVPAAAALMLWVGSDRQGSRLPLSPYSMEVRGGVADVRSGAAPAETTPLAVRQGARLELVLRPDQRIEGDVQVALYWVKQGQARRWRVQPEAAPGGAFRVVAPAEAPFGPGPGEVVALVGRPGDLPDLSDQNDVPAATVLAAKAQVLRRPLDWR